MMHIDVIEIPNCTWELEGDTFFCTHDEPHDIVDYEDPYMDIGGNVSYYRSKGYVCCDPDCDERLEGSPEEDAVDEDWEYEQSSEY